VIDVLMEGKRAVGVLAREAGDQRLQAIQTSVVIDATGMQTLLASQLGLRQEVTDQRRATIWAYYRGGRRDTGINAGATVIHQAANRRCWFWYIPLADDIVSVGLVADTDYLFCGRNKPEVIFEEELCQCPAVLERLMNAELFSDFRVHKDFAYVVEPVAGDGWVLVGDALGFVDPLYSSGGLFAMKSAEMAADCIIAGLQQGDLSAEQLGAWVPAFQQGVHWSRKLAETFYQDGFCPGDFLRDYPQHRLHLINLLAGKVFDDDAGLIFQDLDPWLAARQRPPASDAALQVHPA
jgi:flavin-dependent dehydrogenase